MCVRLRRYNRVNGTHVSENSYIIDGILRKEWGSDALVMSDWCVRLYTWLNMVD